MSFEMVAAAGVNDAASRPERQQVEIELAAKPRDAA
jgi:hypothetical protein